MASRTSRNGPRGADRFSDRYGAWALVAGASQGLGAAFARALAGRGMNLVLVARRKALLDALAVEVSGRFGVEARCIVGDLALTGFLGSLSAATEGLDVGLLVYNAAHAPTGDFTAARPIDLTLAADVNVRGPLTLLRAFLPSMVARGRGGVVMMSSLAGSQGTPRIAAYAATKAFTRVLAEGLWHELRGRGVDVVACCPGAVRTPGYASAAGREAPGTLDPEIVAERALRALGRGPVVIPGLINRVASIFMGRLLPRRAAINIMAGSTGSLAGEDSGKGTP